MTKPLPAGAPRHAFTLVELMIVVVILGILAMLVVPSMTGANLPAREATLREHLRIVRTQIEIFAGQHNGTPPGYPAGNISATPTAEDFTQQLRQWSNESLSTIQATRSGEARFGNYLSDLPGNPFNGLDTVLVVGNAQAIPAADGETYGWFYKPSTRQFIANTPGNDTAGQAYASY